MINKSTSSSLGSRNQVLKVRKSIVFDSKMGMRKFWSVALPFDKVVYAVKVLGEELEAASQLIEVWSRIELVELYNEEQ